MNQDETERARRALVEKRAYEIYQERGGHHGFDIEDWEQAEREIAGGAEEVLPAEDEELEEPQPGA